MTSTRTRSITRTRARIAAETTPILVDAYYAGMILLLDSDSDLLAGPEFAHVSHLVFPATSESNEQALNTTLVAIGDELANVRGLPECIECSCYGTRHLAGECSHA